MTEYQIIQNKINYKGIVFRDVRRIDIFAKLLSLQSDIEGWVFVHLQRLYRYVIKNLHAQARAESQRKSAY